MSRRAGTHNGRAVKHISIDDVTQKINEQFQEISRLSVLLDIEPSIHGLRVLQSLARIRSTVDEAIRAVAVSISTEEITTIRIAKAADVTPITIRSWRKSDGVE